jgi:hypothetical protein
MNGRGMWMEQAFQPRGEGAEKIGFSRCGVRVFTSLCWRCAIAGGAGV